MLIFEQLTGHDLAVCDLISVGLLIRGFLLAGPLALELLLFFLSAFLAYVQGALVCACGNVCRSVNVVWCATQA